MSSNWLGQHLGERADAEATGDGSLIGLFKRLRTLSGPSSTFATGELAGNASATQLPTVACRLARFKAHTDNAGNVYLGISGVTKADGSTDTTTGLQLTPGDDTGWLPIDNLNRLYRICDNAGDDLTYMVLS